MFSKQPKNPMSIELTDRLEIAGFNIYLGVGTSSVILIDNKSGLTFRLCESSLRKEPRKCDPKVC